MMNVLNVLWLEGFWGRNIHFTETGSSIKRATRALENMRSYQSCRKHEEDPTAILSTSLPTLLTIIHLLQWDLTTPCTSLPR
jgi:hypothetical protein